LSLKPVALVTGASTGIGLACAQELAAQSYRVFGASRTAPASNFLIEWVPIDVGSDDSVREGVGRILEKCGSLDLVINCAGYAVAGALEDSTMEDAREQFETNFFGVLRVCRAVLPAMRQRRSGLIVNVSSLGGLFGLPFQGLYCASKFALEGYTETLRYEMSPFGVRVVLLEPGDVRGTGITRNRKHARGANGNSAHRDSFRTVLQVIEREERDGAFPKAVAASLRHILKQRRPRLRYTVGHMPQRLAVLAKRLLIGAHFETIIRSYYGLGGRIGRTD